MTISKRVRPPKKNKACQVCGRLTKTGSPCAVCSRKLNNEDDHRKRLAAMLEITKELKVKALKGRAFYKELDRRLDEMGL